MDRRTKRLLAAEAVHHAIDYRKHHELWRAINTYGGGMTDREKQYAAKLLHQHTELQTRLQKLRDRLRDESK